MQIRRLIESAVYVFVILLCAFALVSCARQPRRYAAHLDTNDLQSKATVENSSLNTSDASNGNPIININEASAHELEKLPGIGEKLATEIVNHRARYGRFRRVEHLLMVRGISENRLRKMRGMITVE